MSLFCCIWLFFKIIDIILTHKYIFHWELSYSEMLTSWPFILYLLLGDNCCWILVMFKWLLIIQTFLLQMLSPTLMLRGFTTTYSTTTIALSGFCNEIKFDHWYKILFHTEKQWTIWKKYEYFLHFPISAGRWTTSQKLWQSSLVSDSPNSSMW